MKAAAVVALVLGAALLAPVAALAAWSADPVTVFATADMCPLVAAASDAQDGTIVVWQHNDSANPGTYPLLARRVLGSGDLDPVWPAGGVLVSSATVNRSTLGAQGDGSGGAYVWWLEGASVYLTRLLPDGTIASGWSARGKLLGTLLSAAARPLVFADGQGGIWLGWLGGTLPNAVGRLYHLGQNGLGVGGWPSSGRSYAGTTPGDGQPVAVAFTYAPAGDGGAWIAWGDMPYDESGPLPGSWRIKRVAASGVTKSGWESAGLPVRVLHGELVFGTCPSPPASLVAVAPDTAGGAYLLLSDLADDGYGYVVATPVLFHLDSTGTAAASWPAEGVTLWGDVLHDYSYASTGDYSLRLFSEGSGGVFALRPMEGHYGTVAGLLRVASTGTQTAWGGGCSPERMEWIVPPSGDIYIADFWPYPTSQAWNLGFLELEATLASGAGVSLFQEYRFSQCWYVDVGLAPTGENGAIFVWSQARERFGIFALRFTQAGQVTAVPTGAAVTGKLRLRYAPGRGVIATLGGMAGGRVQLLDVTGRVCGGADVPAGAREVTLEGTAPLAPGLYFARHRGADGTVETGRVLVLR